MLYTSINNPKIKKIKQLNQKKYRDKNNLFLIEGKHLINEAYEAGYLKEILIRENETVNLDVETSEISENIVKHLSTLENSPGIFGICEKKITHLKEGKILILDGIQDPGNLGTIIRSAAAFNIDTIVINDKCVDPYSPKVVRSSEGMIFKTNIIKENLLEFTKQIKKTHKVYATNVKEGKVLKTIEKSDKYAIIMGNEGQGVSKELLDISDNYLYIPMNKKCESLNVAVATSIILYELGR